MARMIPKVLDRDDTPSPGEKLLFDYLEVGPGAEDWVVFHSQRLASVPGKQQGEADFVVCVPGLGVLVLEVKAHKQITREEGVWYYGQAMEPGKDPFKQASDAMYSLLAALKQRAPMLRSQIMFANAVVFTHVDTMPSTPEWMSFQKIDASSMTPKDFVLAIRNSLVGAAKHLKATQGHVPCDNSGSPLAPEYMEALVNCFRPRFEAVLRPSTLAKLHERELLRLTEEQYRALDEMVNNQRVVFEGPAGTGKTLLAIEAARRAIDAGERVLVVCHNRGLADYLRQALQDRAGPDVFVGTIHSYLMKLTGLVHPKDGASTSSFYRETLPEAALDRLTMAAASGGFVVASDGFDTIVIDELQDLLGDTILGVIPMLLRDGPEQGRVYAFGDLENQAFFSKLDAATLRNRLKTALGPCSFRNLTINCRNKPSTVQLVSALMDVRPPYSEIRNRFDAYVSEIKPIHQDAEAALTGVLEALDKTGLIQTGVVVLSIVAESDSLAASVKDAAWCQRLRPYGSSSTSKSVAYTSVYQFKGLESPIVILTDISPRDLSENLEGLYVGITRATLATVLLGDKEVRSRMGELAVMRMINKAGEP